MTLRAMHGAVFPAGDASSGAPGPGGQPGRASSPSAAASGRTGAGRGGGGRVLLPVDIIARTAHGEARVVSGAVHDADGPARRGPAVRPAPVGVLHTWAGMGCGLMAPPAPAQAGRAWTTPPTSRPRSLRWRVRCPGNRPARSRVRTLASARHPITSVYQCQTILSGGLELVTIDLDFQMYDRIQMKDLLLYPKARDYLFVKRLFISPSRPGRSGGSAT
jgi:hypothetical protein